MDADLETLCLKAHERLQFRARTRGLLQVLQALPELHVNDSALLIIVIPMPLDLVIEEKTLRRPCINNTPARHMRRPHQRLIFKEPTQLEHAPDVRLAGS